MSSFFGKMRDSHHAARDLSQAINVLLLVYESIYHYFDDQEANHDIIKHT